jgi:hypothetical protein
MFGASIGIAGKNANTALIFRRRDVRAHPLSVLCADTALRNAHQGLRCTGRHKTTPVSDDSSSAYLSDDDSSSSYLPHTRTSIAFSLSFRPYKIPSSLPLSCSNQRERKRPKGNTGERRKKKRERLHLFTMIHPAAVAAAPAGTSGGKKDLRRLPHVYSKVLELPLPADTDVAVFEGPDAFYFVAAGARGTGVVWVRTVRIHPGVVKVVVQAGAGGGSDEADDMDINRWRSRLPEASCPAMAVAGYVDGQLVVSVPKGPDGGKGADSSQGAVTWRCCNGPWRRLLRAVDCRGSPSGKSGGRLVVVR